MGDVQSLDQSFDWHLMHAGCSVPSSIPLGSLFKRNGITTPIKHSRPWFFRGLCFDRRVLVERSDGEATAILLLGFRVPLLPRLHACSPPLQAAWGGLARFRERPLEEEYVRRLNAAQVRPGDAGLLAT